MTEAGRLAAEIDARLIALPVRTVCEMRAVRRQYSRQLAAAAPGFVIDLALRLTKEPKSHCRFIAYELVSHHRAAFESLGPDELVKLGSSLDSWSSVDGFACGLTGPAWRDGRLPNAVVKAWTRSPDRWWRRAALVSTVALSRRGGAEDARKTVATCATLLSDRDDMVVKAMSWALRELAKKNPEQARRFLADHRSRLAARVIREVENKLETGLKNPRRGEKLNS